VAGADPPRVSAMQTFERVSSGQLSRSLAATVHATYASRQHERLIRNINLGSWWFTHVDCAM
jgi:hypothetical protein